MVLDSKTLEETSAIAGAGAEDLRAPMASGEFRHADISTRSAANAGIRAAMV